MLLAPGDTVVGFRPSWTNSQVAPGSLFDGPALGLGTCRKLRVDIHRTQASWWVALTLMSSVGEVLSRTDVQRARRRACGEGR